MHFKIDPTRIIALEMTKILLYACNALDILMTYVGYDLEVL